MRLNRAFLIEWFFKHLNNAKKHVDLVTTKNITLKGEQKIDGVTTKESRILVRQTDKTQNGVYVSSKDEWKRANDMDSGKEFYKALYVADKGDSNKNTKWRSNAKDDFSIGSKVDFNKVKHTVYENQALHSNYVVVRHKNNHSMVGFVEKSKISTTITNTAIDNVIQEFLVNSNPIYPNGLALSFNTAGVEDEQANEFLMEAFKTARIQDHASIVGNNLVVGLSSSIYCWLELPRALDRLHSRGVKVQNIAIHGHGESDPGEDGWKK